MNADRVIVLMTEEQRHHALCRLLELADEHDCEACHGAARALRRVLPEEEAVERMAAALLGFDTIEPDPGTYAAEEARACLAALSPTQETEPSE